MTIYEILNFNRELLNRLTSIGFKPGDCRYIDLYSEYNQMCSAGDKVTYIVAVLSDKYKVSERKIYTIIKKFRKDCASGAV
jgi:hypothetical protein